MNLSRRDALRLGGVALAGASLAPSIVGAQTPKRGGTLSIRTWDPPHFDPFQTVSYKTHIALSFTHSRLLKHKAGPGIAPIKLIQTTSNDSFAVEVKPEVEGKRYRLKITPVKTDAPLYAELKFNVESTSFTHPVDCEVHLNVE